MNVRKRAQVAQSMDSSTREKLLSYIDAVWQAALEAVVGSMSSTPTERRRSRKLAKDVAESLDRCATSLQEPVDLNLARKALLDAESCF